MDAYGLDSYRLINLEKAGDIYVEINATMKPGTTKVEMQQMLQNLLIDRFHLKIREEVREGTVYELSVEKGGPKLKERFDDPPAVDPGSLNTGPLKMGADGMPDYPAIAGRITGGFGIPPNIRAIGTLVPISNLATYLESRLRAPVTDVTNLKGKYDFRLDYLDPNYDGLSPDTPAVDLFPPIPVALNSQLGLHLEKKKGPIAYSVLDSIDRIPTEN